MSEGNERGRSRLPLFGSFRWKGGGAGDKVADKTVSGLVVEDKKSKLKPPKSPFLSPRFGRKKSSSSLKSPPPSVEELNGCLRATPSPVTLTHTPRGTPVNTGVDLEQDGNRRPQHKDRSPEIATGPGMSPVVTPTFERRGIKDNSIRSSFGKGSGGVSVKSIAAKFSPPEVRGTIGSPGSNNNTNKGLNDGKSGGKQCNVKDQNIGGQNNTQQQYSASTSKSTSAASAEIPENHHHHPNSTSEKAACKSMSTPVGNRISSFSNKAVKKEENSTRSREGNTVGNVLRFVGTSPCGSNVSPRERLKPPDRGRDDCTGANSITRSTSSSSTRSLTSPAAEAGAEGEEVEDAVELDRQKGKRKEIDIGRSRLNTCTNQCNNLQALPSESDGEGAAAVSEGIPPAGSAITCTSSARIIEDMSRSRGASGSRAGIRTGGQHGDLVRSDNDCNTVMETTVKHVRESNTLLSEARRRTIHTPGRESRECTAGDGQGRRWSEGSHPGETSKVRAAALCRTESPSPRQHDLPSSEAEWADKDRNNRTSSSLPRTNKTTNALSPLQDFLGSASRKHFRSTSEEMSRKSSLPDSAGSTSRITSETSGLKSPVARAVEHNRGRSQSADGSPYPATNPGGTASLSPGSGSSNAPVQSPALKRRFLSVKERAQAFLNKATASGLAGKQQRLTAGSKSDDNLRATLNHGPSLSPSLSKSASAACNINTPCSNSSSSSRMPSNQIIGLRDNGEKATKAAASGAANWTGLSSSATTAAAAGSSSSSGSIDYTSSTTTSGVKALSVKTDTYREKSEAAAASCSQQAFRTTSPSHHAYLLHHNDRSGQWNINPHDTQQCYDCDSALKRINRSKDSFSFSGATHSNSYHSGLYSVVDITPGLSKLRKHFSSSSFQSIAEHTTITHLGLDDDDVFVSSDDQDAEISHVERMDFEEDGECLVQHCGHSCVTTTATTARDNGEFRGQSVTDMEIIYDEPYAEVDVDEQSNVGGVVGGARYCHQCTDSKDSNSITADDDEHMCEYANCGGSHHRKNTRKSTRERSTSGEKGRKSGQHAMQMAAASGAATVYACHNMHVHQQPQHSSNQVNRTINPHYHQHNKGSGGGMDLRHVPSSDSISNCSSGSGGNFPGGKFRDSSGSVGGLSGASSDRNSTGEIHLSDGGLNSLDRLQKHQQHSPGDSLGTLNKHHQNVKAVNSREFVRQISAPASVMGGGQRPSFNSPSCGIRMAEMRAASKRHNSSPYYYTLDPEYIMNTSGGSSGSNKTSPVYCEITAFQRSPPEGDHSSGGTSYESLNYTEPNEANIPARSNQNERPPLPPRDYRLSDEYKTLSLQSAQHQAVLTAAGSASSSRHNTPSPQRHSSPSPVRPYPNLGLISARRTSHDSCTPGGQQHHIHYNQHYTPLMGGGVGIGMGVGGIMHSSSPSPCSLTHPSGTTTTTEPLSCEVVGIHGAAAAAVSNILNHSPHPGGAAPTTVPSPSSSRHSSGSGGVQGGCITRDMISSPDSGNGTNSTNLSTECAAVQASSEDLCTRSLTDPSSENASPRHSLLSQSESNPEHIIQQYHTSPTSTLSTKCDAASQTDKSTLMRQSRRHSGSKSKLRQPGASPSSSMSSNSGAIRKTLENAHRLLSPSPNRGREIERTPLVCRLPKRHNHVNGQGCCGASGESLPPVGSKGSITTSSPTRSTNQNYPSLTLPHPATYSGGTSSPHPASTTAAGYATQPKSGIPMPSGVGSPHRMPSGSHKSQTGSTGRGSSTSKDSGKRSPPSRLLGRHGMKASERHLYRKTNLPKKLLKSPTGMMGVAVAINSDSEFSGSCNEDDKSLQKKLRKPQGLKGGSGGVKGGVRPKVLSGGRDTPDLSINEEDIEVLSLSLSSSESSIASTSSGSDMFTDTERDGEGGATMSISNILDSSTLDDADTSLDLVDMSPMSEGKDIASIEMEDVELSTEAVGEPHQAPVGYPGTTEYNNYTTDITNNLEASVVKPATVIGKEKFDMSMLCEDIGSDIKTHNVGVVVGGSQGSHQENDAVNELDSISHSSSGKFNQQNCVVPNSDSGFVDQSSVASASNPDIKAFSGTLTSPGGQLSGGGGGSTPASPAPRIPFISGAITSNKGFPVSCCGTGGNMYRDCGTDSDKILELTPITSHRILHHSGSTNTSSNDSSPSGSQHQRSPSQQGWFVPPSPSIAPVPPTDSTVTTVTSSCHHQGNNNVQCHVTGVVTMATRTKDTVFATGVAGTGTATADGGEGGEEVQKRETLKCFSPAADVSGNLHMEVLQKEQDEDKPVPPPRVCSARSSGNRRSKLEPPSPHTQSVNSAKSTAISSPLFCKHSDPTHIVNSSTTSTSKTLTASNRGESLKPYSRSNTNSGNSIQGQKAASASPNHTDVHAQGHLSPASNHYISVHSIEACSAVDDSIMSIEQQRSSAVTTCANTTTIGASCKRTAEQQPEQLQTRLPGLMSSTPPASSSTSHDSNVTAQSAVHISSNLPLNTTHPHANSKSSRKTEAALSSTCDCNDCDYKNTNITIPKYCGHTHGAMGYKYINKQYHSRSSSSSSSSKQTHKSSAQNVSISGPNSKSQKDVFCSRHLNDDSASSQNPQSSIDGSCNPRNNIVLASHSNHGSHGDAINGSHSNSANKPLSAIPGRVSRLHHEMEQRKYGSFSSGSSSCSSGASTHSSSSPEKEPDEKGFFAPPSMVKDPRPPEIPKRRFLKDSGLPSYNQTKGATSAIPRDMSHSAASRIRPTSASSASNAASKGGKHSVVQVSRSAPGSPTRAVAIPARGSQLAHPRTRIPSGGHKPPPGHPQQTHPDLSPSQHGDSRSSSLRSNSSVTSGNRRSKLPSTKSTSQGIKSQSPAGSRENSSSRNRRPSLQDQHRTHSDSRRPSTAESSGVNAMPQSPTASRAAKETPNGSTTKPLRSGLRPPSKLKSNKYDHRNHTKNSAGMMVDTESSDSDEGGDQGRPRQKPRRKKPKNKTKEPKTAGSTAVTGLTGSSTVVGSQRSVDRSPRGKHTSKNDDKDGNTEIKSKGRPRHPGRQAIPKF